MPEILAQLSKQAGTPLASDGALKELKAVAVAEGLPLRAAMEQLARLFGAEWRRQGTGPAARYTLGRAAATRKRASEMRERFAARQVESIAALMRATKAEDAQAALEAVNPTVARKWHRPQIPASLRLFDFATRGRYVTAATGRPSIAYRELTPAQQADARRALRALASWREAEGDGAQASRLTEAAQNPDDLVFEGSMSEMVVPGHLPEMKIGERVLLLLGRDAAGQNVLEMRVHVGPMPLPDAEGAKRNRPPIPARTLRLTGDDNSGEARQPPALHHLLPDVARQAKLALFADYFYSRPRPVEIPGRWEGSLEAFLNLVEAEAETAWTLDGPVLRLRSRRWAVDELRDPPRGVLEALAAALQQQGRLDLESCVRAAAMDDQQLDGLKAWVGTQARTQGMWYTIQALAESIVEARPLLRLYGSLSSAQRQSLATGLTLEALQLGQQPLFLETAARLLPAAPAGERSRMRLRLDQGEDGVVFVALFPNDVRVDRPLPIRLP